MCIVCGLDHLQGIRGVNPNPDPRRIALEKKVLEQLA